MPLEIGVIGVASIIATYTDLKRREIEDKLTYTVFFLGIAYIIYIIMPSFKHVTFTIPGLVLLGKILWIGFGDIIKVTVFVLVLFMLGIFKGGDGKFFIAITPWAGPLIWKIFCYFFPAVIVLQFFFLLPHYKFNILAFLKDQAHDTVVFFRHLPTIFKNIIKMEEEALLVNVPYCTKSLPNPPGMPAITAAILLGYFL